MQQNDTDPRPLPGFIEMITVESPVSPPRWLSRLRTESVTSSQPCATRPDGRTRWRLAQTRLQIQASIH